MNFKSWLGVLLLSVGAILAIPSQAGEIRIGVAEALTGPAAKYGVAIRNGFELAAEETNAKGGINGNPITLVVEDEQGKKEEAINVFKKLIFQDKVLVIFGPTLSNSAFAADPVAVQAKVVVFATSNTATGITDMGPWVFRNSMMEADVLPVTLREAVKKFNIRKVAVIYGNDDAFTKSGYEVFKKALDDQKITVTTTETFAKGDVDFRAQLTKIKATNPDAIVASALVEEAANIILQARGLGLQAPFIGGNGFNSPKLFEIAQAAADNTIVGGPWSAQDESVANQAFIAAFRKKYTTDPDQFAAQAYDALHIVAAALKTVTLTGNLEKDRTALRDALPAVQREGATGKFGFRKAAKGGEVGYDAQQEAKVFISQGGKFTPLK
jgi:branched-chain amino acid transport system substrate-binding protein